jgi:TPR repeat protein
MKKLLLILIVLYVASANEKELEKYNKAYNEGDAEICYFIGNLYIEGKIVKQDHSKALKYYAKACDDGNAAGYFSAGVAYHNSEGVK